MASFPNWKAQRRETGEARPGEAEAAAALLLYERATANLILLRAGQLYRNTVILLIQTRPGPGVVKRRGGWSLTKTRAVNGMTS